MNTLLPIKAENSVPKCPQCQAHLQSGSGSLSQSGHGTHLPTTTLSCECGYKHWEPARGVEWETTTLKHPLTGVVLSSPRLLGA